MFIFILLQLICNQAILFQFTSGFHDCLVSSDDFFSSHCSFSFRFQFQCTTITMANSEKNYVVYSFSGLAFNGTETQTVAHLWSSTLPSSSSPILCRHRARFLWFGSRSSPPPSCALVTVALLSPCCLTRSKMKLLRGQRQTRIRVICIFDHFNNKKPSCVISIKINQIKNTLSIPTEKL